MRAGRSSLLNYAIVIVLGVAIGLGVYFATNNNSGSVTTQDFGQNFRVTYYNTEGTNVHDGYSRYLEGALNFWEDKLINEPVISLNVRAVKLQSRTTLAYASMSDSSNIRAGGDITINLNANAMNWTDVLKHEIGHVMGIGIADYWRMAVLGSNNAYHMNSLMFPETYRIYQEDYRGTESDIPLGDVSGHFDESVFTTELMTPFSNEGQRQPITDLTMSALATLGWNIDMGKAEEKN